MNILRFRIAAALVFGLSTFALAPTAHGQLGTGGSAGTGTLQNTDFFLSIQKEQGVNLNERDRSKFLNRANCECAVDAWVRAVILPSAAAKAATIPGSATVSLYIGDSCNVTTNINACKRLIGGVPFPQFRLSGITVKTNVYDLTQVYSINPGTTTSTGGASGTGGAGGDGGDTGTGGAGGGTGGATVTPTGLGCDRTSSTQTLWLFIGTTTDLNMQLGSASQGFGVDPQPPPPLTVNVPQGANQALLVSWQGLSSVSVPDLLGYQVLCSRGATENLQVFTNGSFAASFTGCPASARGTGLMALDPSYVCSEILSTATTSYRLKILENDIVYAVGVTAVDRQGNAGAITPVLGVPVLTRDFYYDYRHGDPQGGASGGFCSIGGPTTIGTVAAGALAALCGLALALSRRRPPKERR